MLSAGPFEQQTSDKERQKLKICRIRHNIIVTITKNKKLGHYIKQVRLTRQR